MRADLIVKGKSLTGSSDLTLLAPLKRGLVPSLEAVSYKTRTQRLLKLLNGGRSSSHEFSLQRPISDSVERVARIHSVRVAVLEPEDNVLLAVTFDGTWEAYIRVLWQKVGTLLDAIFCNTEGYVLSSEGFDAWCGWVNRVQVETGFFFNTHALTVGDVHYLRAQELRHRSEPDPAIASLATVRMCSPSAEEIAYEVGQTSTLNAVDTLRQGLQALALLFRMTDLYLPGTPDGDVLLCAARDLLSEFLPLVEDPDLLPEVVGPIRMRFDRQLNWLEAARQPELIRPRAVPPLPPPRPSVADPGDVQGGILAGYDEVTHACLVLLAFDDAMSGAEFLRVLRPRITSAIVQPNGRFELELGGKHPGPGPFYNAAVTFEGLRRLGMSEAELAGWLPQEFQEGMEARASVLGDFRANHPRRWALPRTNWNLPADTAPIEVQMSAVHMVVQIRARPDTKGRVDDPSETNYVMHELVTGLVTDGGRPLAGVRVLCVQAMKRLRNGAGRVMEHFGFADGDGQPEFTPPPGPVAYPNQVYLGEVLLGYDNEADFAPVAHNPQEQARLDFLHNGSFMVVRKLRQDVPRLRKAVREAAVSTGLSRGLVLAKMMGRWQSGGSLIKYPDAAPPETNPIDKDFTFEDDAQGSRCPFHAHIRRVNSRTGAPGGEERPGRRRPRIVRRGMAYGPQARVLPGDETDKGDAQHGDDADRGLVFIAFNASIAEQFEVVQSWVSGGNSTRGFSGQSDPFLGVPEPSVPQPGAPGPGVPDPGQRYFRFEARKDGTDRAFSIALDSGPAQFQEPEPFIRLGWGAYLFAPSLHTLDWLRQRASSELTVQPAWQAEEGESTIERLENVLIEDGDIAARDAWKLAVEDPGAQENLHSASLWAAVRERGGVLRTPYGVLVASRGRVDEVLGDDRRFSVCGYHERMLASDFDIYLGLDQGSRYFALSTKVNAAIGEITKAQAFELAATTTEAVLRSFMDIERASGAVTSGRRWELNLDAKEVIDKVQQRLCQEWLGLPMRGGPLVPGSWRWDWKEGDPPIYPVHFTPPSRYFFQPRPGEDVRRYGERHAAALAAAIEDFIAPHLAQGTVPTVPGGSAPACLAKAILEALRKDEDVATVARTFAGVLMGFLPTLDANLRLVLNEWLRLRTLWSLRATWAAEGGPISLAKAQALLEPALMQAMQFRSSPELIWRTAQNEGDNLGGVPLVRGDVVVVALVSAMHEGLAKNLHDVMPVFGGDRSKDPHPTHACPGYAAAMGVMLGVLAAFVDVKETMRPSPAPLAFTFEGLLR